MCPSMYRLEELKDQYASLVQANMERYIEKLKNDASKCYEELRTGKHWQEPPELKLLLDEGPSERALEMYEQVIEGLKTKRSLVMPLFKLLDDLKQLKETAKQLEESQKDPQRFKNRGGALLQETKKRERVNKNMPLVVNQIMKFLDAYEPVHGPILMFGKTVREMLTAEQQSSVKLRNSTSTNSSGIQTPLKPIKSALATPSNGTKLFIGGQNGPALKRAGTYTQLKTTKTKTSDPSQQRERTKPLTNTASRNKTTKSPDTGNSKANTVFTKKGTLRRSFSYDDFEGKLYTNDLQSTRVGHVEVFSQASNRRLFF
ncbi:protein regulator of cytokinesis 1-like [Tropilaelaps mercedesae]|uniref:Protein regulator of cytokinesis 1-like n=1 Tax=Tropilaelaps mercedesae TaxID=418985 RepID=A0A1V9XZJ7_9ACAR|nr:protein regulator of cytokinesis 1-like [Tropilaelaps mercedesae]